MTNWQRRQKITGTVNTTNDQQSTVPIARNFWQKKFGFILEEEVWHTAWKTTKETRLRVLQWNISHNIYPTNIILNKINVRESNNCTFRSDTIDYIEYLFCECPIAVNFWKSIQQKLYSETGLRVELSVQIIFEGGGGEGGASKQHICLIQSTLH